MAFLDKFKNGLSKTRDFILGQVDNIAAAFGIFDEEELEDLEMVLIQADVGAEVSDKLMEDLRRQMKEKKNKSSAFVMKTLKKDMRDILGEKTPLPLADDRLNVIMLVGVNGTGKTTTAGKLALRFASENKKVLMWVQE